MIELPVSWFDDDEEWAEEPRQAVIEALGPRGASIRDISRTTPAEASVLEQGIRESLLGDQRHVVLTYPSHIRAERAAATVAKWLGARHEAVSNEIGGHITVVNSGVGHRHDQAWHTDSTPWVAPNRWTVLGSLSPAAGITAPATGILPLARVAVALAEKAPQSLIRLRYLSLEWRANFTNYTSLPSPILDAVFPRWVHPIVHEQLTPEDADLAEAVEDFEDALNSVQHETPVVTTGQIVVFDNHAALHRGPHLEETSGRKLIRIKVGGVPV